jgi:hypothetical protein
MCNSMTLSYASRMKKQLLLALVLSASVLLSGCIDMESIVTVKKDGTGIIEETTLMSAQLSSMMALAATSAGQPGGPTAGPNLLMTREQADAKAKQMGMGVSLQSIEDVKSPDGRQGQKIVYSFTDISRVQYQSGDTSSAGSTTGTASSPTTFGFSNGTLTIKGGGNKSSEAPPLPTVPAANGTSAAGITPAPTEQETAMIKSMFAGMRMALKVKAASGIAATDATFVDGDTVTLIDIQMDKLFDNPAVIEKLSGMSSNPNLSPAAASEAFKGIDGVRAEVKNSVTIKLK